MAANPRDGMEHGATPATVIVFGGPTLARAAERAATAIAGGLTASPILLPSSLERGDVLSRSLQGALSPGARVLVPARGRRLVTAALGGEQREWSSATLPLPDGPPRTVLLPRDIVAGAPLLYVTQVDAVAGRGPFVLDLLARYTHPRSRARQVTDRDRAGLAAEVNLAVRPAWCLIGLGETADAPAIAGLTCDLVAGELVALALAERMAGHRAEFASPWEDRVVQRATELELGARIPDDIRIEIVADRTTAVAMRDTVDHLRQRIGITSPARVRIDNG